MTKKEKQNRGQKKRKNRGADPSDGSAAAFAAGFFLKSLRISTCSAETLQRALVRIVVRKFAQIQAMSAIFEEVR